MNKKTPEALGLSESKPTAFESTGLAYLAWVKDKLDKGLADLKDPDKRISEADVWKDLGVAD